MAQPGDVIEHPSFGARMTFLGTSAETNGELLLVEVVPPPGFSMAEHVHPRQEEQHEVLSGTLRAHVGGQDRNYKLPKRLNFRDHPSRHLGE
jgi:quercetin dioxygenase-like cupin family protein